MIKLPTVFRVLGLCAIVVAPLPAQVTEWTTTVKPGRFLLEMDALSLTIDKEPGQKYTGFAAASTFLSTGLTDNWDVQVGAELFISQKYDSSGFTDRRSGVGDIYVRTKWRFYESAEDYTSIALLPYVKIPSNSGGVGNDALEGGLIVPFQTQLTGGFRLAAMAELDFLRNDADNGYDSYWFASASLSRQVVKLIGVYAELAVGKSAGGSPWAGTLGGGVTLTVSDRTWWDYAVYRGLSNGASDWTHVLRLNYGF